MKEYVFDTSALLTFIENELESPKVLDKASRLRVT